MKHIRLLALALVAALLLAGCSSSDDDESSEGASSPDESTIASEQSDVAEAPIEYEDLIGDDDFRTRCVNVEGQANLDIVEPACAYLVSLVTHDGSKIPMAPDAWRIEQGVNTGAAALRSKKPMRVRPFSVIANARDFRWFISGEDEGIVFYTLDIADVPTIKSVLLAERFKVVDRLITEIEVVFYHCAETVVNAENPDGSEMCPASAS